MGEALDELLAGVPYPAQLVPTIGRIVHYRLREHDAARVNARRRAAGEIYRSRADSGTELQCHDGNEAQAGDACPMLIVAVWGDTPDALVNGQVFLDGNDVHWATSVGCGEGPGTWSWPPRG
ncbi:MAG: hypothetical protein RIB84_00645 [Sneathiellaceae bacterium]